MSKRKYMAYLLRLWRENGDGPWRALLENPNTKERIGFANLNELIQFLENKTREEIVLLPPEKSKMNAYKNWLFRNSREIAIRRAVPCACPRWATTRVRPYHTKSRQLLETLKTVISYLEVNDENNIGSYS